MTNTAPIELEQLFRFSRGLPHQLAAISELQEALKKPGATYATVMRRDQDWFRTWSTDGNQSDASLANWQSWLTFLTGPEVGRQSRGTIKPLTAAEACGFIGCIIVETGRPLLDKLDVIEAGSGAGRGAMQYTGVRRVAYDKARAVANTDPNSNAWQQLYFAQEYAGLHDPPQGSLIGWTKVFEDRPSGMDPSRAAAYWTAHYFRPGVPHLERRQQEAQRVWELVQSKRLSVPAQWPPLQQQPFGNPLQVPWYSQLDSTDRAQAARMCFSSSNAMLLQYLKPGTLTGPNGDDQFLKRVQQYGDTTNPEAQIRALSSYGIRARMIKTCTFQQLEQQINCGVPVPCGFLHRGPVSRPSGGGHWLIVVGYTSTHLFVHDPFGEADLVTGATIGGVARFKQYSRKNFSPRWMVEGNGAGWAIIAER